MLTKTPNFLQVTFEGIAGTSFTGDIAIDSVEIKSESCPGKKIIIIIKNNKYTPTQLGLTGSLLPKTKRDAP